MDCFVAWLLAITTEKSMFAWTTTKENDMPRSAIHPGEHLAEELRELGMAAAELARQIDVPVNRITGIINGQRAITADTALRLGHWFGVSPEFWLNLQKLYELRLAEKEIGRKVGKMPTLKDRMAAGA
jgi:addiction module HigA family antidote